MLVDVRRTGVDSLTFSPSDGFGPFASEVAELAKSKKHDTSPTYAGDSPVYTTATPAIIKAAPDA
jgi:hypothetical protein